MTDATSADLTMEIGELIVEDTRYTQDDWVGIGIVATFFEGSEECSGYRYFSDGSFVAGSPKRFGDLFDKLLALRDHMGENGEGAFVQCLIHITKPDYALRIQYEHDDPKRWWPGGPSADMAAFAEQLRPEGI